MQTELTHDSLFDGRLTVRQALRGYRFSIDSILLANAFRPRPRERIVDLGTGCGVVLLILAFRHPNTKLYGVEIQTALAEMARINVEENGLSGSIQIVEGDMGSLGPGRFDGPVDRVVSNPPYRKAASGRINPNQQRAVARHEIRITLAVLMRTAGSLLRTAGRFTIVYAAERLADLIQHMRACHLEPKSMRFIHSNHESGSKLVLVTGVKHGKPGVKVGAPIVIYKADGSYSDEVEAMFQP